MDLTSSMKCCTRERNVQIPFLYKSGSKARHRTPYHFRAILDSDQAGGGHGGDSKALPAAA